MSWVLPTPLLILAGVIGFALAFPRVERPTSNLRPEPGLMWRRGQAAKRPASVCRSSLRRRLPRAQPVEPEERLHRPSTGKAGTEAPEVRTGGWAAADAANQPGGTRVGGAARREVRARRTEPRQ